MDHPRWCNIHNAYRNLHSHTTHPLRSTYCLTASLDLVHRSSYKSKNNGRKYELLLSIAPVEIKSRIQDNKNKNVENNNKTSGAVWLRSMVFNGK